MRNFLSSEMYGSSLFSRTQNRKIQAAYKPQQFPTKLSTSEHSHPVTSTAQSPCVKALPLRFIPSTYRPTLRTYRARYNRRIRSAISVYCTSVGRTSASRWVDFSFSPRPSTQRTNKNPPKRAIHT